MMNMKNMNNIIATITEFINQAMSFNAPIELDLWNEERPTIRVYGKDLENWISFWICNNDEAITIYVSKNKGELKVEDITKTDILKFQLLCDSIKVYNEQQAISAFNTFFDQFIDNEKSIENVSVEDGNNNQ